MISLARIIFHPARLKYVLNLVQQLYRRETTKRTKMCWKNNILLASISLSLAAVSLLCVVIRAVDAVYLKLETWKLFSGFGMMTKVQKVEPESRRNFQHPNTYCFKRPTFIQFRDIITTRLLAGCGCVVRCRFHRELQLYRHTPSTKQKNLHRNHEWIYVFSLTDSLAKRSNCFRFSFLHGGWSEPRHRANIVEQEHLQPTKLFLLPNSIQHNSQFFFLHIFFLFKSITHSIEHLLLMLRHCVLCAWFLMWFSLLISFCSRLELSFTFPLFHLN